MSYIQVFGDRNSFTEEELAHLEKRFIKLLSEVLKINDQTKVEVVFISGGSITFGFTMPLQLTAKLRQLWVEQPETLQIAFRGLASNHRQPVISFTLVAGTKEVSTLQRLRDEREYKLAFLFATLNVPVSKKKPAALL